MSYSSNKQYVSYTTRIPLGRSGGLSKDVEPKGVPDGYCCSTPTQTVLASYTERLHTTTNDGSQCVPH